MASSAVHTKRASTNPLDDTMTAAQVARRKFKAGLPRKLQARSLSVHGALGETFTLLDTFRSLAPMPELTILAALAYFREAKPDKWAEFLVVPEPGHSVGKFCDAVAALAADEPKFLGVVFVQVDLDTQNPDVRTALFSVPFMSGPEAASRLQAAQHGVMAEVQQTLHAITK